VSSVTISFNNKFIRETMLDLSHDALILWLYLQWEKRFPRSRVLLRDSMARRHRRGLFIPDTALAYALKWSGDVERVKAARQELVDKNLLEFDRDITYRIGVNKEVGIYRMRKL